MREMAQLLSAAKIVRRNASKAELACFFKQPTKCVRNWLRYHNGHLTAREEHEVREVLEDSGSSAEENVKQLHATLKDNPSKIQMFNVWCQIVTLRLLCGTYGRHCALEVIEPWAYWLTLEDQGIRFEKRKIWFEWRKFMVWMARTIKKGAGEHFVGEEKSALESKLTSAHQNQVPHL